MSAHLDIRIRSARAGDEELIKQTIRQARLDRTGLDWRRFKLAESAAGGIIGMCQVRSYWDTRELGSLVVLEAHRGQGIGGQLICACLKGQCPPLYLECLENRQSYYQKFGFCRIPKRHAPRGLRLKAVIGGTLVRLVAHQSVIVMRWDGAGAYQPC